ncbi:tetratricopeptide repeat-containing sulfotransferase family protein [Aliiruegeria lutimaris]|uniref:Tetratricopeptide repeat-containing protein n=1 Tax=Aliiruegeria lutimaris TaxID=571298 RepID=A0A1G8MA29_9RHOB|nr:sulfotransferase [Aliiruegeria lutimaris]SDI64794.1 Tetratricopeptide repeat-containing protein [Aliiruegeria lutimaris]
MLPVNPARFSELFHKTQALEKAGRLDEARDLCSRLIAAAPQRVEPHFQLARIERRAGDIAAAIAHLRDARELKPKEPAILAALADMLSAHGDDEEALQIHDILIRAAPRDARYLIDKALVLQRTGAFEKAETTLRKAQALDPLRGEPYRMLTANRKVKPGDPLIGKMKAALRNKKLSRSARVEIEFALAKAMEDTEQYDKVFRYLAPANATMKSAYGYDASDRQAEVNGLIEAFHDFDFTPTKPADDSFTPIFVTGLPRSGTTLVEQILASHSQVISGGEMPYALRLCYDAIGNPGQGFAPMAKVAPEKIARLAEQYQAAARSSVSFDRIVTDKAIQSHLVMGLLKMAVPAARFIVVRRDPRDLLYSIYKNMFAQGTHRYAYDLEDLAKYYASFLQMLDFWRENLPGGFHEVHYEELVADPEAQSRALVAAAGLDWEDACLEFHKSRSSVKTLSVQQVRQPIYRSSAQAWRRYETDLQPLVDALEREGVL